MDAYFLAISSNNKQINDLYLVIQRDLQLKEMRMTAPTKVLRHIPGIFSHQQNCTEPALVYSVGYSLMLKPESSSPFILLLVSYGCTIYACEFAI